MERHAGDPGRRNGAANGHVQANLLPAPPPESPDTPDAPETTVPWPLTKGGPAKLSEELQEQIPSKGLRWRVVVDPPESPPPPDVPPSLHPLVADTAARMAPYRARLSSPPPKLSTPFGATLLRARVGYHGAMEGAGAGATGVALRRWRTRVRRDGVVLLPLLALTLAYFAPLLFSGDVIYGGLDITRQFFAFKQAAVADLQAGHLPLWLPTLFCGMPLLGALIDTPFHPWDFVAALAHVPLPVIFNVGLLLHLLIGQVGAYVWVRQDSLRRLPAALAACWIWNPFVLNSIVTGDHNNIRAMLLVPAIFAALERGLDRGRFHRAWLAFGVLQALQILCSGLQFAFYTCAIGGLCALGTLLHRRGREPQRTRYGRMRWWLFGSALALTLPMVQLLPGLEFAGQSVRGGTHVVWSGVWGIHPGLLLSYVAPFVDRGANILLYWGLVPLVFAGIGILAWRHPRRWWYVAVLVAALVLCIGSDWIVSGWLNTLPLLRGFRGPFRVALFANLMLARLAAGGLSATLDAFERHHHVARWAAALRRTGLVLAGLIVGALLWWPQSDTFGTWNEVGLTACMWGATAFGVILLFRVRQRWAVLLLVALVPLDLGLHLGRYWHPASTAAFAPDGTAERLRAHDESAPWYRVWLRGTPSANYLALSGVPSVAGHHAFPLARAGRLAHALNLNDGRLLRATQTRYVLTYRPLHDRSLGPPVQAPQDVEIRIVRGEPVPRFHVRGVGRWLPTGDAVWEAMRDREWDPGNGPVLLEGAAPESVRAAGRGGTAKLLSETDISRRVEVQADGAGYLVIADTWYPHWQATVNGARVPLLRANYAFQAVPIPAGGSIVEVRYASSATRIGLFTTGLALVALAFVYPVARRRDVRGVA